MDAAGNILVIKTVSGMASAVGAAVDAMKLSEVIGSIAGDDTLMCVVRSQEDALNIMKKLRKIMNDYGEAYHATEFTCEKSGADR